LNPRDRLASPTFFVSFSLMIGILNFLDTFVRLMFDFVVRQPYPLGLYLKPVFFLAQAAAFLLFIRAVRFVEKPHGAGPELSRFLDAHVVLAAIVTLLYVDFVVLSFAGISSANAFVQFAFYLVYLVALAGTCFWFAWKLVEHSRWREFSLVFVLMGFAFVAAFLEPMLFWGQNYAGLVFSSELAYFGTYAPHIFVFLVASLCLVAALLRGWLKQLSAFRFALFSLVPAFSLPLLWDGYRDGLVNFVVRDVFYWGLGYSGFQWFSVSFYFVSIVVYVVVWRMVSRRSPGNLAYSLITLGVASLPWNGVVLFRTGYSSVLGNALSLSSIVVGVSLLAGYKGGK